MFHLVVLVICLLCITDTEHAAHVLQKRYISFAHLAASKLYADKLLNDQIEGGYEVNVKKNVASSFLLVDGTPSH